MPAELSKLSIAVPKPIRDFIVEQAKEGGFADVSEYIRHLVRQERDRQSERLAMLIAEGLAQRAGG